MSLRQKCVLAAIGLILIASPHEVSHGANISHRADRHPVAWRSMVKSPRDRVHEAHVADHGIVSFMVDRRTCRRERHRAFAPFHHQWRHNLLPNRAAVVPNVGRLISERDPYYSLTSLI